MSTSKSILIFSIVVIFISTNLFGQENKNKPKYIKVDHSEQPWYIEIQKEVPNYYIIQKLYNDYFESHPLEKSIQKKIVRRWLQTEVSTMESNGDVHPYHLSKEDYQKIATAEQKNIRRRRHKVIQTRSGSTPPNATWNDSVGTWRMIGPYHGRDNEHSYNMYGGFTDRVYINPYNRNNMFSGQSYGGIWTSQDAGATWKLTDSEFPNGKDTYANRDIYYGEIEAHPLDHDQILAGTEAGLLISTDAGESWTLADSMNYMSLPNERSYFVAQKPDDTQVMLVSYGKKIFRSSDGGSNWTLVFDNSSVPYVFSKYQHNTTGVFHRWYNFCGLQFHPTEANIVYLGALNSSNEVCLYRSIDAGLSFSLIKNTAQKKWLKMLMSLDDEHNVYFANIFINGGNAASDEGIYKYDTSGTFVSFTHIPPNDAQLLDDITVDQNDADVWYFGGYASSLVMKSTDAGQTWFHLNDNQYDVGTVDYIHPDVRSLCAVGDTVLVGTDGGLHKSYNGTDLFTASGKWVSAIDLWGFSSAYKGEVCATGDDHGPVEIRVADIDKGWNAYHGADSGELEVNKCRSEFTYSNSGGRVVKIVNDSTLVDDHSVGFSTKFEYLAQDPNEYFKFYPYKDKDLKMSDDNMTSAIIIHTFNQNISKVEVCLDNNQILYVLEKNENVFKTTDGGTIWTDITPSTSVTNGQTNISDIEINETGDQIWLSYGQYQSNCKVVQSTDAGNNWTNITTPTLPSNVVGNITYQRGTDGMVYITMNLGGVWYRSNTDSDWSLLGTGLPTISYMQTIYTVPDMNKFRMGTSRGAFEHDLPVHSNLRAHFAVDTKTRTSCSLDTSYFYDYSSYYDNGSITFNWTFEGGTPGTSTDMNPKVIYDTPGIFDVSLTISDGAGNSHSITKQDFMIVNEGDCDITTIPSNAVDNNENYNYVIAPSMGLQNTTAYTMMAWVKGEGTQRDYAGILSHKTSTGNVHLNVRGVSADNSSEIGLHHPNGHWYWSSGLYLVPNHWTHVALVVAPNSLTIYKNGKSHVFNTTVAPADLIDKFEIGTMIDREGDRSFKGLIDEVAFYDRALTADEIRNMMHLTKENPNYPSQHDSGLVAYYQFNSDGNTCYDVSGNNKKAELYGSDIHKVVSDGPFGGGQSDKVNVSGIGLVSFPNSGVKIDFSTPVPDGDVVVSHIENLPDVYPSTKKMHEAGYYIMDNYGMHTTIGALNTIEFTKTGTISNQIVTDGGGFELFERPTNKHDDPFNSIITSNFTLISGNFGHVKATDAFAIDSLGQYIIGRNAYPSVAPAIKMVSPDKAGDVVEGGISISLYMDSDNQGLILPLMSNSDFSTVGQATEGMLAYSTDEKALVVYSYGVWKKIDMFSVLNITEGSTDGTTSITFGNNPTGNNAIVELLEKGFIKYNTKSNADLTIIKYPVVGMMIYNIDEHTLQSFDGSHWNNISLSSSSVASSSDPAVKIEGFSTGNTKLNNAVLQDSDDNAVMMIPTLAPESIKAPVEGMFIFDPNRKQYFLYDGSYWNKI